MAPTGGWQFWGKHSPLPASSLPSQGLTYHPGKEKGVQSSGAYLGVGFETFLTFLASFKMAIWQTFLPYGHFKAKDNSIIGKLDWRKSIGEMKNPEKEKLNKVFENLSPTPQLAEGYTFFDALKAFFNKPKTIVPEGEIPIVRTDLKNYYSKKPSIIWFGHSSYLIHVDGINMLVDPVLSGHASPFRFQFKAFKGTDFYKPADMPPIDCLILTHNHYDHMDYAALKQLAPKTKAFVMPLRVSRSLSGLPISGERITELNWWQSLELAPHIRITATPARHFSGRSLKRNGSLWASYVLEINGYNLFLGGDSGYDGHFKEIGNQYGPFDLALLECGQYSVMWPYIHSMPEELIPEGQELKAKVIMPVHWGKFALSTHDWNEPIKRFVAAAEQAKVAYTTPLIGEPVIVGEHYPNHSWWLKVK